MRGRQRDAFSTYKRMSSRDYLNAFDKEDGSGHLQNVTGKETANPSWKHSLPHILVATISSFLFGYHLGVVNETLESISLDLGFNGSTLAEGLVVSTCLAGAFVGSLFSGWIADGIGRRRAFQLCSLPMIIGASMSATTKSLHGMLLGRFIVGTGMGIGPPVASLYVTEVSPAFVRGTYGSFTQIATCLGLMGALFIGIPAKEIFGWWRVCFWVSSIPAAMLALFMEFCAESPHWLFKRGRGAEAEAEFEKVLGGAHVKYAIAELSKSERGDEADTVKFSDLLYGRHFRVVFIGSVLYALQQLSGINAVFYFSSAVFKSAGVPSEVANTCVGISNLSGSIVAMVLMDKLGRKVLLLGSFFGMAVSMGIQVIAASSFLSGFSTAYLSVGGMLLFVLTFAMGAGPVPGLLLPEILPSRIRAKALAVCLAVHWVINFFVGLFFLRLLEQMGPQVLYSIFAMFCLTAVVFVKKNVVETKGKSLQEIEIALLPVE
ncbi:probable plastidic glucose transporter 3 [Malania oleifera]|uniref:probable plastidic glucose transporter 3 n=1 Tax=Malania oleifera TaxID=397392 RepID=UPI0025AE7FA6|nr:probable plastidic glucose transporter 3 [Malania oleifera]XP_057969264.1 probable plastidic glucose transporter 3 [Malania oleifera]XP_057969265.1 probable plastidic glucose transporter 3 [Malania oleifera]XP_057969266.1 probable plastidic glucose transporter 3 [Malania oleifera]XP_057969267.1 probable plastidic glucose transporter 3 [Malania oleifera]XP_057969268.1 probable plastidic glucose transporter 3 [Malania oleifera]